MKVQFDKKDYDNLDRRVEIATEKFVNKKAKELVMDFQNNVKLRKYLNSLIRNMVREELMLSTGSQSKSHKEVK